MALLFVEGFEPYAVVGDMTTERGWTGNLGALDAALFRDGGQSRRGTSTVVCISPSLGISTTNRVVAAFWFQYAGAFPSSDIAFAALGNATVMKCQLRLRTDGTLDIADALGASLAAGTAILNPGTWYFIELRGRCIGSTAAGDIQARVDEVLDVDVPATANTAVGAAPQDIDNFFMIGFGLGITGGNFDNLCIYDETGAQWNAATFEGGYRFEHLAPDGNGATSQLVGQDADSVDNYLNVDENPHDGDVTYNGSATPGELDTYAVANLSAGPNVVLGVQTMAIAKKTGAGARTMRQVRRSGGTNFFGPSETLVQADYNHFYLIDEVDPNTGVQWLEAAVDAAEFGVEVET